MTSYFSGFYPAETANGAKGSAAFVEATNTAILQLYKRSATTLSNSDKPNGVVTYTFATAVSDLSTITNGWTSTIPAGSDPLYVVGATAASSEATDTIAVNEWSTPVILVQNGTGGLSTATVFLFKRGNTSTLPAVPTQTVTYTFASGIAIGSSSVGNTVSPYLDGWTQTAPDSAGNKYLFMITGTAISTGSSDSILTTEWSTVRIMSQDGAVGYTGYLTNEAHTLAASSTGSVTNYGGASGDFKIFLDGVGDISSSFSLSTVSNPQVLTVAYSGNTYTISGGFDTGEDTASITIRATGSGAYAGVILDKVFSLAKAKSGSDGSSPKLISLSADRQLISYTGAGALSPSTQTTTLSVIKQNTTATVNWTIRDVLGNTLTPASYLSATTGDSITMTAANFQAAISVNTSEGVVITATLTDGVTVSDRTTIMKVKAGADGTNGTNGTNGAPAASAYLTRESQTLFAYAEGTVVSFATANGNLKIYSGNTDVTSSATSFSATASGCTGTINTADNTPVNGQLKGYYQITAMSADTATLTLSATYAGTTFTKVYTITKAKGGYEILGALPSTNLFQGRTVFLTTDNKLYRYTGSAWVTSVASTDISGTLADAQISALAASKVTGQLSDTQLAAIAAAKITGTITGTQITDGAITTAKISAGAVTAGKIAADAVTANEIAANAITASEIAAGAITAGKIAAGSIVSGDIAADTITAGNIAANAITSSEIATNAITADKVNAGAITAAKLSVIQLDAITATIGTLRTATTGPRTEISDNVIKVFDTGNVLRVKIGNLAL
jgi:hypothetical protein